MSADGFTTSWLKERFRYDNAARNPEVEKFLIHHFRNHEKLNIVDIGSGTGANCLYFIERLFKNQNWTLIEQDANLCEATIDRIERFLQDYNFFYSFEANVFRVKIWESRVKITILNASFFDIENLIDLKETDVVMAAAVFDVLTFEQFEKIINPIMASKTSIFSTMNYQAMRFIPKMDLDSEFLRSYENHMQRVQPEGQAMGPACINLMEPFFIKNKLNIVKGNSQWKLDSQAKKMHDFLFGFIESSIGEETGIENWLSEKRKLSQDGGLVIEVGHIDFFIN